MISGFYQLHLAILHFIPMLGFVLSSYHIDASYFLPFSRSFGLSSLNLSRTDSTSVIGAVAEMQEVQIDV
jgi:hypothetical protein